MRSPQIRSCLWGGGTLFGRGEGVGIESQSVSLNRGQFARFAMSRDSYRRLAEMIGADRAEEVVRLLYGREARDSDPAERYVIVPCGDLAQYSRRIDMSLQAECSQIEAVEAHAAALLRAAVEGALRPALGVAAGKVAGPEDIDLAAGWIGRTLHADRTPAIRATLAEFAGGPANRALGATPEILDRIHARLFPEAPDRRSPNPDVAYPSSVGGRHVLEKVFSWTADAVWPRPGEASWLDVALFFLGAVGTAQGYADGNKRMARFAYALTLLRGRHPFVAPGEALEQTLIRMAPAAASAA